MVVLMQWKFVQEVIERNQIFSPIFIFDVDEMVEDFQTWQRLSSFSALCVMTHRIIIQPRMLLLMQILNMSGSPLMSVVRRIANLSLCRNIPMLFMREFQPCRRHLRRLKKTRR